jgi:ribosome-associated protein YbcJ (S4-like RNA binding protein)
VETQKRKLVVAGDIIEFGGATLQLTSTAAGEPTA